LKPEYALRAKKDGNAESFLKQRFRRLDTDHSGYVTKEEARAHPRQFVKFLVSPANVQRAGVRPTPRPAPRPRPALREKPHSVGGSWEPPAAGEA
jgi:hypothetical protein